VSNEQWFSVILKVTHPEGADTWDTTDMFGVLREGIRAMHIGAKMTVEEVHADTGASEVVLHAEGTQQRGGFQAADMGSSWSREDGSGMSRIERILDDEMDLN
jgi:hypothetical protein